jgi:hypothetical protein
MPIPKNIGQRWENCETRCRRQRDAASRNDIEHYCLMDTLAACWAATRRVVAVVTVGALRASSLRTGASALRRIGDALRQPDMFIEKPKPAKQETML